MKKLEKAKAKINELNSQKVVAEVTLQNIEVSIETAQKEYAKCYEEFFNVKRDREFVLYDRFPPCDAFKAYSRLISNNHPLNDYGNFNIKELAEIIRYLYQETRQEEYQILTMGTSSEEEHYGLAPHLYFAIGNCKTLSPYQMFNGQYFNDEQYWFLHSNHEKNIISIEPRVGYDKTSIIEVLTGSTFDIPGVVNFKDYKIRCLRDMRFSLQKNIFAYPINKKFVLSGKTKGVKDILSIDMHKDDTFIAKVLISIAIYKKNNDIKELTEQDYNHIFEVLFGHPINIIEEAEKDIPKSLIYVPRAYED